MKEFYDAIYLSPHLDDAALSCGGQIFEHTAAGRAVLVVTLMAGDPPAAAEGAGATAVSEFAQSLHARWQLLQDATAGRRAEDLVAMRALGCDAVHWDIPDCIYRAHPETGAPLYPSLLAIFGAVDASEAGLIERLAQRLDGLPRHGRLIAPLTVGHHVDHQITRQAAERCFGSSIAYYEDYPYAATEGALEQVIPPDAVDWLAEVVPLPEAALQAKFESIATYASQVSTFFNDRTDLEQQVRAYADAVGGERLWRRAGTHD